ncbi:MAG: hypothetical protein WCW77_00675 [Patescibacteria group bacterium]|jgi:hypothetical protein
MRYMHSTGYLNKKDIFWREAIRKIEGKKELPAWFWIVGNIIIWTGVLTLAYLKS